MLQAKKIKAEKPLISNQMLTGAVAHDVVEAALARYKEIGKSPEEQLQDAREICKERLREYYTFSKRWADAAHAGRTLPDVPGLSPMEAVFRGFSLPKEEGKSLIDTVETCVRNFLRSPVYRRIMALDPQNIILQSREPLQDGSRRAISWYWVDENPIYASYDLILLETDEEGERRAVVIDWKTGSREKGEDKVERQLNYYAPFVAAEYGIPCEQIELIAAWIGDGAEVSSFEATPRFVESHSAKWKVWREDLRLRTVDVTSDPTRLDELFPMTSNLYRCRYCKFQSCPGQRRQATEGKFSRPGDVYLEPVDLEDDY